MIYCVEDERNIRELLVYTLSGSGYEAKGVANGKELKKALKEEIPDLILLDIMLPGEDGYAVLEYLKGRPDTQDIPVIMVTAKEAEYDKVRGLEGGADDFITKPFGMMEFLARVKAVLRRTKKQEQPKEYHYKGLTVDMKSRKVRENGRCVDLTLKFSAGKRSWRRSGAMRSMGKPEQWMSTSVLSGRSWEKREK